MQTRWLPLAALLLAACDRAPSAGLGTPASGEAFAAPASGAAAPAPATGSSAPANAPASSASSFPRQAASAPPSAVATATALAPLPAAPPFGDLVESLSEPDAHFFSDNYVSNETSYLAVAPALAREVHPGGAYLGVGPEQNFTYIALTKPTIAFVVDIRRQNLILHLFYRALFDEASTRTHFLALLTGRAYDARTDPGGGARIDAVMSAADRPALDEPAFAASHARLRDRIEHTYGVRLDAKDVRTLERSHRAFFRRGLDLRFELEPGSGSARAYPKLRELLSETSPDGAELGFLASEDEFRFVQRMEREGRIVPVVGDFAGERAMPAIAAYLRTNGLTVSAFYVSNVEQYLFEPGVWSKWSRNVGALPIDDHSVFIRAYLDQGRRHPRQLPGHRTATVLSRIADFEGRQQTKPYASWWAVATDALLDDSPPPAQLPAGQAAK